MNRSARTIKVLLVLAIVALSAAPAHAKKADHDGYVQTNLVSDGAVPAIFTDPNLKNPWGISFRGGLSPSPFWISDNNGGVATLYDGTGASIAALPLVTIPMPNGSPGGTPTGTVQTMGFHRSTDFGHTWQGPFIITPASNPHGQLSGGNAFDAADKEFADVDPETGRVMMTWSNFTSTVFAPGGVEISSTFSDNVMAVTPTWSARTIVAATASDGQDSVPRFARGSSNVYAAWLRVPNGARNLGFAR